MTEAKVEKKPRTMGVLEDLRELNESNDKRRREIQDSKAAREVLVGTISRIESEAMRNARDAKNDEGEKLNTNDTLRKAAAEGEIIGNQDYQVARKALVKLDDDVATDKRILEFNAGEWRILLAEVNLLVAQLTGNASMMGISEL